MSSVPLPREVTWMLLALSRVCGGNAPDVVRIRDAVYSPRPPTEEEMKAGHKVWPDGGPCPTRREMAVGSAYRCALALYLDEPAAARIWALRALDWMAQDVPGERALQMLDALGWDAQQTARQRLRLG